MQGCVGCGCPNCRCAAMGGQNAQAQALAGGPAAQSAGTPVTAGGPASPAAAANSAKAAPGTATANAAGTGTANAVAAGGPAGGAPLTTADLITQIKTLLDGLQKLIGQLGGIQAPAAAAVPAKV